VGDVPIDRFSVDHALVAMQALPADLKPATRAHVARAISRVLTLAAFPCRIIPVNPLPKGFVPSPGKPPARSWWRPADDADLLECDEVPLLFRFFYGFTFREGLRESEAGGLTWRDVAGGSLTLDENKTDDARSWMLYPGTAEALAAWKQIVKRAGIPTGDADRVFVHIDGQHKGTPLYVKHLAEDFRDHVTKSGLWRADFAAGPNRKRLDFHDLRGGFVSWALATGRTEAWVTDSNRSAVPA
jgi:integrase